MQTEQLHYIIEVGKTGSISEAANNLHISTSAISQSILNFEEQYGVKVFTRSRQGTKPTEIGKVIIEKLYEIKDKILDLERVTYLHQLQLANELTIVSSPSILLKMLPKTISTFKANNPNTIIKVIEMQRVVNIILENKADIGIFSTYEVLWNDLKEKYENTLYFDTLFQGRMYACVHRDSPLSIKERITPEDLHSQTLIVHKPTIPIFEEISSQHGDLKVIFETDNTETIKKAITEGLGISILSEFSFNSNYGPLHSKIVPIPFINHQRSTVICGYIRSKEKPLSASTRDFIKTIQQQVANGDY
ncbi:LysR family transcriptional activator of glutamate synthase operon [Neobacillus niacini]|uniref:LysR family transcriptional regulator n=1 Tax=Neobacillus niacini TaxID=86668 RepID=UPI0027846E5A|nr:LysR family transcriptional regulator [Neobacillus niacini]MDQ1002222.1 LysR family transcriptional activator of glutamate synthase operon [Neobacillus niacini]